MTETAEVVKIRIDSLEHNRQLITTLAAGLTGIYTIIAIFSTDQGGFFGITGQASWSWFHPAWHFLVLGLLLTLALVNLCFILAAFLLTDSIHHYSKILEYRQKDWFTYPESKARLAYQRALASDDLSYFYVKAGAFFLTFNLLLAALTVVTKPIQSIPLYAVLIGVLACGLVAFAPVLYCYRASHFKEPEYSVGQAIVRFWNFRGWRNAARTLKEIRSKTAEGAEGSDCR